jgi:drug/metabolite transporter (DMT)-like permease
MGTLDSTSIALVTLAGGWPHPEYAAVTASMFGIVTVLLAWRFLGEAMRMVQWIGILAAFSGIAILTLA